MKDKHNVILILVSSSKFNSLFRRFIKILDFSCSCFLPDCQVFSVISFQSFILALQGFTWCFQLLFLFIILLLPEFFMEALHDGWSRIQFLLKVFIEVLFRGVQEFFFHLAFRSEKFFLSYHWRWYYVILDNLSSCFMIHTLLRMRYFKSINLFVGVILV